MTGPVGIGIDAIITKAVSLSVGRVKNLPSSSIVKVNLDEVSHFDEAISKIAEALKL